MSASNHPYTVIPKLFNLNFTQAGAVQNTWYTAFTAVNAELIHIAVGCTVANETVGLRITIDGIVFEGSVAINATEWSHAVTVRIPNVPPTLNMSATAGTIDIAFYENQAMILKGRCVLVAVRKTTAAGASALRVVGLYGVY